MRRCVLSIILILLGTAATAQEVHVNERYGVVLTLEDRWSATPLEEEGGFQIIHAGFPDWSMAFETQRLGASFERTDEEFGALMQVAQGRHRLTEGMVFPPDNWQPVHGEHASSMPVYALSGAGGAVAGYIPARVLTHTDLAGRLMVEQRAYQCGVMFVYQITAPVTDADEVMAELDQLRAATFIAARGDETGCDAFRP